MFFVMLAQMLGWVVVLAAPLIWLVVAIRGRRSRIRRPICAVCGYSVENLHSFTCPECGVDVRRGGIATPRMRGLAGVRAFIGIASWTSMMLILTLISTILLTFVFFSWSGGSGSATATEALTPVVEGSPIAEIRLDAVREWGNNTSECHGEITLESADGVASTISFRRDSSGTVATFEDGEPAFKRMNPGAADMKPWLERVGVSEDHPEFDAIAAEISEITGAAVRSGTAQAIPWQGGQASVAQRMFTLSSTSTTHTASNSPWDWLGWALFALGVLIWVFGCVYIVRKTSKRWTPPIGGLPAPAGEPAPGAPS